jgi:hypothetical protein
MSCLVKLPKMSIVRGRGNTRSEDHDVELLFFPGGNSLPGYLAKEIYHLRPIEYFVIWGCGIVFSLYLETLES